MIVVTYTVLGFILGSIPFAFYLAKYSLGVDVREYGSDGNPGAVNAWRAGGWRFGVLGGILDFAKGFIPVFVAQYVSGLSGWALFPIAIAPILGHAFSPLLSFHGGKAVAASFGVWAGLSQGWGFLVYAATCGIFWRLQTADAWATVMGQLGLLVFLLVFAAEPYLLAVWVVQGAVVTWKHRRQLRHAPHLRSFDFG
jgi:glycerol-3-phosphate acyltransferase PlsY